jgi:diaminopimelate epimerase
MRLNGVSCDFVKYHALGNDYCVIDPRATEFYPSPENIRLVCDRHFGLGCDGVLLGPLQHPAPSGHWYLRIFNPDGTECEKSGNGLRVFARYLLESGTARGDHFTLHSAGGPSQVRVTGEEGIIEIDLGPASLDSEAFGAPGPSRTMLREPLHVLGERAEVTCVTLGNPHCVVPLDEARVTAETAHVLGPALRDHEAFLQRVNVQLLSAEGRHSIRIEVFERGAGYTLASGSCAAAAAFAAHALGLTGQEVKVHMPGGAIDVRIAPGNRVTLSGRVQAVLSGRWAPELRASFTKEPPDG